MGVQFFNATSIGSVTAYGVASNLTLTVPTPDWDFPRFPLEWGLDATDTNFLGPRTSANGGFYTDTTMAGGDAHTGDGGSSSAGGGHGRPYVPPSSGGGGRFDPLFLISSSCPITNLTAPFLAGIAQSTNRHMAITWPSCPIFRYIVYSANQLTINTAWLTREYVWGQVNATTTSFTDTTTTNTNVTQRFYKVQRILGSQIGAGGRDSLAITPDGTLWAWGGNDGQLGDGLRAFSANQYRPYPGEVAPVVSCFGQFFSNAVAVAGGGDDFTVVADADGRVWTTGEYGAGQLGNGSGSDEYTPAAIAGVSNVVSVAAGFQFALALRSDGTVWAWGDNSAGQLGNGGTVSANSPIQSSGLSNIVAVAAGLQHSVALDANGNVWTWGEGDTGQLGNGLAGDFVSTNVPAMLTNISNVIAIAAGQYHTIALTTNKTVWTWGKTLMENLDATLRMICTSVVAVRFRDR